ncbi:uncharacterized protein TRAVEDRAFT_71535 [Trametes versicolor FP-101664 SS1]|uniref:uncharacterized protein n=1 Tax=Trametes versicolor (strain FP-101664) TaxID=717944 RepID=UPI0004622CE9|nr:uncharacterized protein TRAVEDRAFT_71535 [Trametes versicolor FP-101664 SS1]EIW59487.1 hypothetical protein TRAVEDRAFT_71535 [Trametes versicolor FP-101664 SS1]
MYRVRCAVGSSSGCKRMSHAWRLHATGSGCAIESVPFYRHHSPQRSSPRYVSPRLSRVSHVLSDASHASQYRKPEVLAPGKFAFDRSDPMPPLSRRSGVTTYGLTLRQRRSLRTTAPRGRTQNTRRTVDDATRNGRYGPPHKTSQRSLLLILRAAPRMCEARDSRSYYLIATRPPQRRRIRPETSGLKQLTRTRPWVHLNVQRS